MAGIPLGQVALFLEGELIGDASQEVNNVVHPSKAESATDLAIIIDESLVSIAQEKGIQTALVASALPDLDIPNQIRVERPRFAIAKMLTMYEKPPFIEKGIHPSAVIDPSAQVADDARIGPLCWVGPNSVIGSGARLIAHVSVGADCKIGDNCLLFPGVRLGDRTELGTKVILHQNTSVGSDGFGYITPQVGSVESIKASFKVKAKNTEIHKINHIGYVVIEDDVEIGANSCVDRGTVGPTRIKKNTKIDNQVQIAHNVTVGENCLIAGQTGIPGSVTIGNRVVFGARSGTKDHITVGDDAIIMPLSAPIKDVPESTIMGGAPAMEPREYLKNEIAMKKLKKRVPKKLEDLERRIQELEEKLGASSKEEEEQLV